MFYLGVGKINESKALIAMFYLGVGKINESKALIAVTSCSNYQINNDARIDFNQYK